MRKSEKGRFLKYLSAQWGMVPTTMIAKFKGRNNFKPLEILAVSQSFKDAKELFDNNNIKH